MTQSKKKPSPSLTQRVKEVESQLLANSKDSKFATKLIRQLKSLQKEADLTGVEILVPSKSVTDEIDFGATKIQRCAEGFLFTAKGGLQTLISWRMARVCALVEQLFKFRDNPAAEPEMRRMEGVMQSAVLYVLQSPVFASLDALATLDIANAIIQTFNRYAKENIDEALPHDETEEDIKENIEQEKAERVLEQLTQEAENLPDYEKEEEETNE